MDPESKKLLEETYSLTKENNAMLSSIKRSMLWARVVTVVYWIAIIGVSVGAFYFVQPYIDQLMEIYGGAKSNLDNVGSLLKNFQN